MIKGDAAEYVEGAAVAAVAAVTRKDLTFVHYGPHSVSTER